MTIEFRTVKDVRDLPTSIQTGPRQAFLIANDWDDYTFKTLFSLIYFNSQNERVELGSIKIGYLEQSKGWSLDKLPPVFNEVPVRFFSLGQDVNYYQTAIEKLTTEERHELFSALGDIVFNDELFQNVKNSRVFKDSLTRNVSSSVIHGQFKRVLKGQLMLDIFQFAYRENGSETRAGFEMTFNVEPGSKPPTNIHVLIGRNGVGKTTILNSMVQAIYDPVEIRDQQFYPCTWNDVPIYFKPLSKDYFSNLVSVSFSSFDPFIPPADLQKNLHPDYILPGYFYIGMKKARSHLPLSVTDKMPLKTESELAEEFSNSFQSCLSQKEKITRWMRAMQTLEADSNFADENFKQLLEMLPKDAVDHANEIIRKLSSGHKIVLLTITKLVDTVEDKTLVLLDEPESHLHPPLLSAFMRALSDLLNDRNGLAIVATHSPVVLQEVPSSCVWILSRSGPEGRTDRPERETFGENVGILTREVFGLQTDKSGFHELLRESVETGRSFDEIMSDYNYKLGIEAQGILRALISARNNSTFN